MNAYEVRVHKKPPRIRGPTWTDEEVHKLFHVWSQPNIFNGFLNEKRKREVLFRMSSELIKLNVNRSWEECRAKIKNLKGEYKKARDGNCPQSFKHFAWMEKILNGGGETGGNKLISLISCTAASEEHDIDEDNQEHEHSHIGDGTQQPVQIEFKIMPTNEIDFGSMKKDGIPIEISPEGNYLIPHTFITPEVETTGDAHTINSDENEETHEMNVLNSSPSRIQNSNIKIEQPHSSHVEAREVLDTEHGTSVIVITTTENINSSESSPSSSPLPLADHCRGQGQGPSNPKQYPYRPSYTAAGKRIKKSREINLKRRKLHSLSETMAETVDRVLTRTTDALIKEFKASEDRFMEWEEKTRAEEQLREEKLLQRFISAIGSTSNPKETIGKQASKEEEKEMQERKRILSVIRSSDDPCAMAFDLLATRLTTMLSDQQQETEQSLYQWESKMQKQEMKHTENLFSMILNAVKSNNESD